MKIISPLSVSEETASAANSSVSHLGTKGSPLTETVTTPNSSVDVATNQPDLLRLVLEDIRNVPYNKSTSLKTPSGNYSRNWSAYNASQVNELPLFKSILKEICEMVEEPEQHRGRPRISLRDMLFSGGCMVYNQHAARRFEGNLKEIQEQDFIKKVPHHNTISHFLRRSEVTSILTDLIEITSLPLKEVESHFSVDSTGLTTNRYARWVDDRTKEDKEKQQWVKIHLMIGTTSNIVTAAVVTGGEAADGPQLGRLMHATKSNFNISAVSGDAAYLSGENMRHIAVAGALPLLKFKSNNLLDSGYAKSQLWKNMWGLFNERFYVYMSHYNKRNNVESTFSMIKRKFGGRLFSVNCQAQINEALLRVLCHNICTLIRVLYELNVPITFPAETSISSKNEEVESTKVSIAGGRIVAMQGMGNGENKPSAFTRRAGRRSNKISHQNQISLFE
jgi:transposase